MANEWNLNPLKRGYHTGYSSSNRPGTVQSIFATVLSILPLIIFDKYNQNNIGVANNSSLPTKSERSFKNYSEYDILYIIRYITIILIFNRYRGIVEFRQTNKNPWL